MNAKVKKGLLWALAAIFVLIIIQWFMGGVGMHAVHQPPHMYPGHGPAVFMRGHHGGGFHFISSAVSFIFWAAVIALLAIWLRKKLSARSLKHSPVEMSIFTHTYTSSENQPDFLDEWEKKQLRTKEDQ